MGQALEPGMKLIFSHLSRYFSVDLSHLFSITSATLCDGILASEKATFSTPFAKLGTK